MRNITFTLLGLQILLILFFWRKLPPEIPLFYSRPWGEEQLANSWSLFILPSLTIIVFLINFSFSYLVKKYFPEKEEKLLLKILEVTNIFFSISCLITLIKIVFLVI